MSNPNVTFLSFSDHLSHYFETINKEWINEMFVLEDIDKKVLECPKKYIIDKGGEIYFAQHPSLGIVGTCALLNKGEGNFELTKMGVFSNARYLKVGQALLKYVINEAQQKQLNTLFLLTNKNCSVAIHLYEKSGFVHDDGIMQRYGKSYKRCDVAMRYAGS